VASVRADVIDPSDLVNIVRGIYHVDLTRLAFEYAPFSRFVVASAGKPHNDKSGS